MRNRIEEIKAKGFNISTPNEISSPQPTGYQGIPSNVIDYNKIKVGVKTLDDAIIKLSELRKTNPRLADKATVLKAINDRDLPKMREISDFFYRVSGIYARIIRYMAFMYRYDWMITPYINDESVKKEKVIKNFQQSLDILDNFEVKKTLGEIALQVLLHGAYYGYKVETDTGITLQELPVNYCRSRFYCGKKPVVEFNMKFFDEQFRDTVQRMKVLKAFPDEFLKGYKLYKKGG